MTEPRNRDDLETTPAFPRRDPADFPDREALLDCIADDYMAAVDAGTLPDPHAEGRATRLPRGCPDLEALHPAAGVGTVRSGARRAQSPPLTLDLAGLRRRLRCGLVETYTEHGAFRRGDTVTSDLLSGLEIAVDRILAAAEDVAG